MCYLASRVDSIGECFFRKNILAQYRIRGFKSIGGFRGCFPRTNFEYLGPTCLGASVAKWLAHLPFTSEAAGSSLSENFLNATRTQSSCEKSKSQRSAESRGFSPGTPVSSHWES